MFVLPKDYRPSKSVAAGESFEVIAKVVLQEDGSFHVTEVDGQEVSGEKQDGGEFDEMVRLPAETLA